MSIRFTHISGQLSTVWWLMIEHAEGDGVYPEGGGGVPIFFHRFAQILRVHALGK